MKERRVSDRSLERPDRRAVLTGMGSALAAAGLSACTTGPLPPFGGGDVFSYAEIYGPMPQERFPIPAADLSKIEPRFYRREVFDPTGEEPGSIVVDTKRNFLHFVMPGRRAVRYGVGLGREGFEWAGRGYIAWKQAWPRWVPPEEMIARQPELEQYSAENGGMPPSLTNPLGARALYIFQDGKDTLFRVHGTIEFASIGRAVSSGCVRMLNQDVIDLYNRVSDGASIMVV
jgi:lipoprotein-anchoring transpeptidase ErfK/SrfK